MELRKQELGEATSSLPRHVLAMEEVRVVTLCMAGEEGVKLDWRRSFKAGYDTIALMGFRIEIYA